MLLGVVGGLAEDLSSFADRQGRPSGKRTGRGLDGDIDIGWRAAGDLCEHLSSSRIGYGQRIARVGVLLTFDEGAGVGDQSLGTHAPTNSGGRFCTKACRPSEAS